MLGEAVERERLIAARQRKRWTQEEAAEKIGVSRKTYARWETGHTTPIGYNLRSLCTIFETTPDALGLSNERVTVIGAPPPNSWKMT